MSAYTAGSGLVSDATSSPRETGDGALRMGTESGLARVDGEQTLTVAARRR